LLAASATDAEGLDESHVGFRLGPRINAVGRLEHADLVVKAFVDEDPQPLIEKMGECNLERKRIQEHILREAREQARAAPSDAILFLGGDWHPGVVGIAASRIAEEFWRPTWLFQRQEGVCKGSARSIPGFDVTDAMASAGELFRKFGGHAFAGGFTFDPAQESALRDRLQAFASRLRQEKPQLWESRILYDCRLPMELASLELADALSQLKPFGNGFEEPRFYVDAEIASVEFYYDKSRTERKHTAVNLRQGPYGIQKVMFFNEVLDELSDQPRARFVVSATRNVFRGRASLSLIGHDFDLGGTT
jgi:single-stranded-DNA-specific exonuclease